MGTAQPTVWGLFFSTATLMTSFARGADVTCSTDAAVRGGAARVTCHFPVNVMEVRPVIVSVERSASLESNFTEVLECRWMAEEEAAACTPREGYVVDGPGGSELSLHIPSLSERQAGRYACKMMTPDLDTLDTVTCQLHLPPEGVMAEDEDDYTDEDDLAQKEDIGLTEYEEDEYTDEVDLAQTEDNGIAGKVNGPASDSGQNIGIVVGVTVAAVIVAIVVVGVAVFVLRRRKASSKMSSSSSSSNSGAEKGHGTTRRASAEDVKPGLLWSCLAKHGRSEDGMPSGVDSEFNLKNRSGGSQDLLHWVGKERVVATSAPALVPPPPLPPPLREEEVEEGHSDLTLPQTERPPECQPLLDPVKEHSVTVTAAAQPLLPKDGYSESIRSTVETTGITEGLSRDEHYKEQRGPSSTQKAEHRMSEDDCESPGVDIHSPASRMQITVGGKEEGSEVSLQDEIDIRAAAYNLGVHEKIKGRQFPFNTGSAQRDQAARAKKSVFGVFPNSPGSDQL